jgi:hypothetical protein
MCNSVEKKVFHAHFSQCTERTHSVQYISSFHVIKSCYHLMFSHYPLLSSQGINPIVIIPCYNPVLSPVSSPYVIPCYPPMVSPHVIIPCYNPMTSSHIIIPYHHPISSSHIIIPYHHPISSSHIIIPYHHPLLSSHVITHLFTLKVIAHVVIPCYHPM